MNEITELLAEWSSGNKQALDRLIPLVYPELHRIASRYLRGERQNHTLQSTALVHEAYLRLVGRNAVDWKNRAHFLGVAAQIIRSILVDRARARAAAKRGAGAITLALDEAVCVPAKRSVDLIALDDALGSLRRLDPQQEKIVELRFFGGLTNEETAQMLGVSSSTVKREWSMAKAWIFRELAADATPAAGATPGDG